MPTSHHHISLDIPLARRLALYAAGLLNLQGQPFPRRLHNDDDSRIWARRVIEHFGYLQLDTIPISGARSHSLVLASRLDGFSTATGEQLLQPGEPHFEYWGHEACWMPLSSYPVFEFRRQQYKSHPWWGNIIDEHPGEVDKILRRIETDGPVRSADLEGDRGRGFWDLKLAKKICDALWSCGELAISARNRFLRTFDLRDRVIPASYRTAIPEDEAIRWLLLKALQGHGWATGSTMAATWRLTNRGPQIKRCISRLHEENRIVPASLKIDSKQQIAIWVTPEVLSKLDELAKWKPTDSITTLLSPFDPVLWDRSRVALLFGFDQILEIYKPAHQRKYGYYCLPVLSGENLIARVDLKAKQNIRIIEVISIRYESTQTYVPANRTQEKAVQTALARHHRAVFGNMEPITADGLVTNSPILD